MIGLARGTVKLLPYNYEWAELYKQEEKLLYSLIGQYIIDIQHVGSTSIEGLDAKPIIDIAAGVKSLDDVEKFRNLLEGAGYQYRGSAGVEGRVMFAKGSEDSRSHYLHIEVYGGKLWENHIYFRDYLCLHKESLEEYSKLKKELAAKFGEDRKSYTSAKNDFISSILKRAGEEMKE